MSEKMKFVFKKAKAFVGADDSLNSEEHTIEIECLSIDILELRELLISSGFEEVNPQAHEGA